jgi:hypothetical protein
MDQDIREISQNQRELGQNAREDKQISYGESQDFKIVKEQGAIVQGIADLKEDVQELKDDNRIDHTEIIKRQDYTNGKVAEIMKWKERATGIIICLTALGIITWLGKYIISFLEK